MWPRGMAANDSGNRKPSIRATTASELVRGLACGTAAVIMLLWVWTSTRRVFRCHRLIRSSPADGSQDRRCATDAKGPRRSEGLEREGTGSERSLVELHDLVVDGVE